MASIQWQHLESDRDLDQAIQRSHELPVVLFKHSTRCSVSSFALRVFEQQYGYESGQIEPYFLDLIRHRDLSNRIAKELAVHHESPQMIVVKDGMAVYDTSHSQINAEVLKNYL
ncbi:bacillithiol system redox-active protein YtxJ [Sanyastnella coralliicola]|uniref:bacillithiol system redox-active protein YtxJ n=1 Tax=Sanyastnella coralliicola TaxID=3069118 RepID=UPI0027B9A2B1|nr:bacillithiol system redox-active protein YtxJ [Longitalea sp. SCSIO 12813]